MRPWPGVWWLTGVEGCCSARRREVVFPGPAPGLLLAPVLWGCLNLWCFFGLVGGLARGVCVACGCAALVVPSMVCQCIRQCTVAELGAWCADVRHKKIGCIVRGLFSCRPPASVGPHAQRSVKPVHGHSQPLCVMPQWAHRVCHRAHASKNFCQVTAAAPLLWAIDAIGAPPLWKPHTLCHT